MGRVKDTLPDYEDYEPGSPPPTREELARWREFRGLRDLADTSVTPDMTHREMLQILQARLCLDPFWYREIRRAGGPTQSRLDGYIAGVLGGYAMRVDPRIRVLLLAWDHERVHIPTWTLPKVRPGVLKYHPGRPPPHRRRREARERKAAADAAKQGAGQG